MEFPTGTTKGIILPIVSTLPASPTNGTSLMDKNDLKVKAYQHNAWLNLSDAGSIQNVLKKCLPDGLANISSFYK